MPGDFYEIRNREGGALESQHLVRTQSVASRVIAGETLIVPIRGKVGDLASIYTFNEAGSLVWKMLETPRTLEELASGVIHEFDVDPERAAQDVRNFVREMSSVGLIEVATSTVAVETSLGHQDVAEAR